MATTFIRRSVHTYQRAADRHGISIPVGLVYFRSSSHPRDRDFTRGHCYANDKVDVRCYPFSAVRRPYLTLFRLRIVFL